ncbi:hypothetical protein [Legionella sp. WA2022007384]
MRNALAGILTLLLLPFTALASVAIVALLLAMLALVFPVLVLGGTFKGAGYLSEKFTEWLFPNQNKELDPGNGPLISSISTTLLFLLLLPAPVAVGAVLAAGVICTLLIPALAVSSAYLLAKDAISRLFTALDMNNDETPIKHSYSKLPKNSDEVLETLEDIPCFGSLFKQIPSFTTPKEAQNTVESLPDSSSQYNRY